MNRSTPNRTGMSLLKLAPLALVSAVLCAVLTGCSLGDITLSGPQVTPETVAVNLQGKVHGGQQGISFSTLKLYATGSGSYGAAATLLTTKLTGATQYYPGGATGCLIAADPITAYAIVGGTATFTAANSLIVGQLVTIADSSPLNGTTALVTAATAGSFSIATTASAAAGTDTGTATPTCYNFPTTDVNGNFNITGDSPCGTSGSSITYLLATGGNPGYSPITSSNSAITLAAPLGTCSGLSNATQVTVNELTTAAMAYAMGQYFTPTFGSSSTDSFGAPASFQAQTGLTNAYNTVANLATVSNGFAVQSATLTGASNTVTVTPEWQKLNLVANILAACVNSQGPTDSNGNCTTLFGNVAPSTGTTPTDTLQAAVYMSLNPTSTATAINNLYNLVPANLPFVGISALPTDWTIAISYASTALTNPQQVEIDAAGNVWAVNPGSTTGAVTELSPTGTPIVVLTTVAGVTLSGIGSHYLAIDGTPYTSSSYSPNVYFAGTSTTSGVYQYSANNTAGGEYTTSKSAFGITFDSNNNLYLTNESSTPHFSLDEIPAVSGVGQTLPATPSTTGNVYGFPTIPTTAGGTTTNGGTASFQPGFATVDVNGNIWMAPGTGTKGYLVELTNITSPAATCPTPTTTPCFGPNSVTTASPYLTTSPAYDASFIAGGTTGANAYVYTSNGLGGLNAALNVIPASGGGVWTADSGASTISLITNPTTGTAYGSTASLSSPKYIAMDGSGNIWVTNNVGAISGGSTGGSVSEFSSTGTVLSPTSSNVGVINPGYIHTALNDAYGIAVDPSGNVWVADNVSGGTIVEIVGAATPVVTPLALQLKSATFPGKP